VFYLWCSELFMATQPTLGSDCRKLVHLGASILFMLGLTEAANSNAKLGAAYLAPPNASRL
jgi:hypothetical protein